MDNNPRRRLRQRLRKTAGKLMEDTSIRSNMDDEQADKLLKWGMSYIESTARSTLDLPSGEALPQLEKQVTAVRMVMQHINKLMGATGKPLEKEVLDEQMMRIFKNMTWLTGQTAGLAQLQTAYTFQQERLEADEARTFDLLITILDSYNKEK